MLKQEFVVALARAVEIIKSSPYGSLGLHHPLSPSVTQAPSELLDVAYNEPQISALDGMAFNHGQFTTAFKIQDLLNGALAHALMHGVDSATAAMQTYLETDCHRRIDVQLLEGIRVTETIEITEGVILCPPDAVPSSTLQAYLQLRSQPQSTGDPGTPAAVAHRLDEGERRPTAALYNISEVRPKFFQEAPPLTLPRDVPVMYQIAELLTVLGPSSPVAFKSFSELADGEFLKGQMGLGLGTARNATRVFSSVEPEPDQIDKFKRVAAKYLMLSWEMKQKLRVPLQRLNEAVKHRENVDRALDLGIALESLLLNHQPSKEQLSLQFRIRGAWLLGESGQHRAELFDIFNKLYSYRSFAAHSGAVAPAKTSEEEVKKTLEAGLRLCADAIRKVIDNGGFPAWDRLVVGADYVVQEERSVAQDE
ncbi:HEPN domain-containing protein [Burkholderia sp. Z1]|uniref:HEPN domain-containing protein n=1 Tax=Burkholderia sp. Z1 TaxID=2759039 RepID=UPI0018696B88|nr:HEPN domain-containing protein [Burkholderia sp. Z1]